MPEDTSKKKKPELPPPKKDAEIVSLKFLYRKNSKKK